MCLSGPRQYPIVFTKYGAQSRLREAICMPLRSKYPSSTASEAAERNLILFTAACPDRVVIAWNHCSLESSSAATAR